MKSTLNYEYDYEYDLVDIVIDKSHKYEKSIEITKGCILDLDENGFPSTLEIISASKILGIHKWDLISPDIGLSIKINEELICIEMKFIYLAKQEKYICFRQNFANTYGIPSRELFFEMSSVLSNLSSCSWNLDKFFFVELKFMFTEFGYVRYIWNCQK